MDLISRVPRLPRLGETIVCHSFQMSYGGKGANQAVMAAKLRAQVTLVTKLGRDVFGEGLLANYRQQGVDTTMCSSMTNAARGLRRFSWMTTRRTLL